MEKNNIALLYGEENIYNRQKILHTSTSLFLKMESS